jgi:hypothetical protein
MNPVQPTDFQQQACAVALQEMFTSSYFDVCVIQHVADTLNLRENLGGADYHALRTLHCVHWTTMGPDLTQQVREKCLELLGISPETVNIMYLKTLRNK